jgi:hypothetical protein
MDEIMREREQLTQEVNGISDKFSKTCNTFELQHKETNA